jgi:hypothetical protein
MSRRYGGQSPLAVDAKARGAVLPESSYYDRVHDGFGGFISVRKATPKLPHLGQIRKMSKRGFKT